LAARLRGWRGGDRERRRVALQLDERAIDAEGRAAVTDLTGNFSVTLFDCRGLVPCTGEMAGVTIPGTANYRHRVFEQVIPLRNQVWNPS